MSRGVPILMYHQVTRRPDPGFRKYAVGDVAFSRQMRWLGLARYTAYTMDDLLAARERGRTLPPRSVIITFDDGFRDCLDSAVPALARHRFTATFFVVTGLMGEHSAWLVSERGLSLALMDWHAARELEQHGFRCESHSVTHPRLAAVSTERCAEELRASRDALAAELGRDVRHLAYPYGSYSSDVAAQAVATGYATACTVDPGLSGAESLHALRRLHVSGFDSLLDFACRLRWGLSAPELVAAARARLRPRSG
ncbi:MAG: polysaccharide deacetylase family protein [Chloroflexota bacterium]